MRRIVPTALLALAAGLVATAPPALAASSTSVSGWSTQASSITYLGTVKDDVRVLTAGKGVVRKVRVQHRRAGTTAWISGPLVTTSSAGYAALTWRPPQVSGRYAVRAYAVPTSSAVGRITAARAVTVREDWASTVFRLTNEARSVARTCGGERYAAAPRLIRNSKLDLAARRHAIDMAKRNYFDHTAPAPAPYGSSVGDRATAAGYAWSGIGENIAAGYDSPRSVVDGWLRSSGHCANIMRPGYRSLGIGLAYRASSSYGHYWVQNFGTPR